MKVAQVKQYQKQVEAYKQQLAKPFLTEGPSDPDKLPLGVISFITGERSLTQKLETLDLTNPKTLRDSSKSMGAQTKARLKQFLDRYKYLEDPTGENTPPYHWSHDQDGTNHAVLPQAAGDRGKGGHFDLPDGLFHSIPDAWKSASQSNMADIKELVPEFLYMPEFQVNGNHFELLVSFSLA
ncbi:hypothetical protein EMCRGX_G006660 [Ephydatia muelleri]